MRLSTFYVIMKLPPDPGAGPTQEVLNPRVQVTGSI